MVFGDEAKAHILYRTHLPTSAPEDWRPYIDLDDEDQEFDISVPIAENRRWEAVEEAKRKGEKPLQYDPPPRQCVWPTRRSDRPGETLYRIAGARRRRDRWVLCFEGQGGRLNRELTREAAAHWLRRINEYALPPGLHITRRSTDADFPRLRPDWRPASKPSTPSDDDRPSRPAVGVAIGPPKKEPAADADAWEARLEATRDLVTGKKMRRLVGFLAEQAGRKATLMGAMRILYPKIRTPTILHRRNAQQQIRRTDEALGKRKAPLRVIWDWELDEIELVDPHAKPGPATPSGEDDADVAK
jgi:hypothetical protein